MWPHKKGLGIRLSHGIQGNATIQSNTPVFPRQNIYSPIDPPSSSIQVVPSQINTNTFKGSGASHSYVPSNLISSLSIESSTVSSVISFDPSQGDVVNFCHVNNKPIMVHVTGETESILTFTGKNVNYSVELTFPIRQITSKVITEGTVLLVRTPTTIYVILVTDNVNLSVIGEINVKELSNCEFVDVVFDESSKFGVIDVEGNFAIYTITKRHIGISQVLKHRIESDVSELSRWKRIGFIQDTLVTLSRSKLTSYTIPKLNSTSIVTANTWSRLRDIHIIQENIFLLTSKELIWFNDQWDRLISWKHYLQDSDPSLKLQIYLENQKFNCLLYTQSSPLVMVYTLGKVNNRPSSLCDPYYIRKSGETRQVCVANGKLYLIGTDLSITCQNIDNSLPQHELKPPSATSKPTTKQIFKFTSKHIDSLIRSLTSSEVVTTSESQQIQNYAYNLSSSLVKQSTIPSYFSLYELCGDIPQVSDLLELDDMIVQFENSVDKVRLISLIHKLSKGSHIDDIANLFQELYENRFENVAVILGTSLIKCHHHDARELLESEYKKKYDSMSNQVKSIFDEWEGHQEPELESEVLTQKLTQVDPIRSPHPLSQVTTSQRKSQRTSQHGSQRSSQPKRKKRKGF